MKNRLIIFIILVVLSSVILVFLKDYNKDYYAPEMVLIPEGTFLMGDDSREDEKPAHKVKLNSFYIGKYEVTNKEYCKFDPEHENPGDNLPVVNVSWYDAVSYSNWLNEKEGLASCYSGEGEDIKLDISQKGYRLPTEAEWEYACRAGSTTRFYWGDEMDGDYCWYSKNHRPNIENIVGTKKTNDFGLYDMIGNVAEWCHDIAYFYPSDYVKNPIGPEFSGYIETSERTINIGNRIFRGGGFWLRAEGLGSALRDATYPEFNSQYMIGFRLARTAK